MTPEMTYEAAMARLETIAREMEMGETPIDELAAKLREAKELVAFCRARLTAVEQEIQTLTADNQD